MDGWMGCWMYGWRDICTDRYGWMDGWKDGVMEGWRDGGRQRRREEADEGGQVCGGRGLGHRYPRPPTQGLFTTLPTSKPLTIQLQAATLNPLNC
eukprot:1009804-Rhodomonas_salina.15